MNKQHFHIGIPTILMIIFSLCLFIFSILSFTSSYSDYKLSKKMLERTTSYYESCNAMQNHLQDLSISLTNIRASATSANDFQKKIKNISFEFDEPINQNQTLHVEAVPVNPFTSASKELFTITCWKVMLSGETVYDEHLHVIP